jgi:hypothetical protein
VTASPAAPAGSAPAQAPVAAPANTAGAAPPLVAAPSLPAAAPLAPRAPETFWYRPTDEADTLRPWNSSILGAFDPWTRERVTIVAQKQTLRLEGKSATGNVDLKDSQGNGSKVSYAPITLEQDQLAPRLEWGNWSIAWAHGSATLREAGAARSLSTSYDEVTISRGFGGWAYDFGIPDIRLGISWPELFLRGGVSGELKNVSPLISKMQLYSLGLGLSLVGLRVTIGDVIVAEVRTGLLGVHSIGRNVTYRATSSGGSTQDDVVVQSGTTRDWFPTFRLGIAL